MKSSRQTQPYRKGPRTPGMALTNMLRGRTTMGYNPKDIERYAQTVPKRLRRKRPVRPARPSRPARP